MAEETDQERTEEPTAKRLSDARKQGQSPRSRELNTLVVLLAGVTAMAVFGAGMMHGMQQLMEHDFRLSRRDLFDPAAPLAHLGHDLALAA